MAGVVPRGGRLRVALIALALTAVNACTGMLAGGPAGEGLVLGEIDAPGTTAPVAIPAEATWGPLEPIRETWVLARPATRPLVEVPEPTAGAVAVRTPRPAVPSSGKAVFLGDSYTTGYNGAGLGAAGWPRLVANVRGWKVINLAVAGTGYINPGWTGQPIGTRVDAAIRAKPAIVFIAGGHNDSKWSATATGHAADRVIDRVHAALPRALLVIVAPIWPSGSPPVRCLLLRDHLRAKARSIGAIFIDPLGEGWFAGTATRLISNDGIHPTDAGHRRIAAYVLKHLE